MSTSSLLRPLLRTAAIRRTAAVSAPSSARFLSTKPALKATTTQQQQQLQKFKGGYGRVMDARTELLSKMTPLQAAMPQMVPFYFVSETLTAFILIPMAIYIMSKYILPQRVRKMCARLFISKL